MDEFPHGKTSRHRVPRSLLFVFKIHEIWVYIIRYYDGGFICVHFMCFLRGAAHEKEDRSICQRLE